MQQFFYQLQVKLLLALSPATLFHKISLLPWYADTLQQWADSLVQDKKQRVLDAGCATGYLTQYLYNRGHNISGVDLSNAMIKQASKREAGIDFKIADASQLPYEDEEFELIVSASLINIVNDAEKVMQELIRVNKKNGKISFIFPQKDFNADELEQLIIQLNISGFSQAALRAWNRYAPKIKLTELENLLHNTGYKIKRTKSYLNGMVLSVTVHHPYN